MSAWFRLFAAVKIAPAAADASDDENVIENCW